MSENVVRIYRNKQLVSALNDNRQRVTFLEGEASELHGELVSLRQQLSRTADRDALLHRLHVSETNNAHLERQLEVARADLYKRSSDLTLALYDANEQRQRYIEKRDELKRVQESSAYNILNFIRQ